MTDPWAVGLAVAVTAGAWWTLPVPPWLGAVLAVAAMALRRPALLCLAALLLAGALADRAWRGAMPVGSGRVEGPVTLLTDPERVNGAVRVVVRWRGDRFEVWARASPARRLERHLAGERVIVSGTVGPAPERVRRRLATRHIRGRMQIDHVGVADEGSPAARAANRLRRVIDRGGGTFDDLDRALYTGMIIGDDRALPEGVVGAFRASGLSHLTAVSGQNIAFLLAVVGPLLQRLRPWSRWAATIGLVAWFAMMTRFEPSVLRAAAMAALAATAFVLGRPASTLRLLALAVAGLLLVDPLLVWSVGWWLSVGATAGIAVLSAPITDRLPGPRSLAGALGVTIAAQVGVAPVSIAVFGGLPLASIPANILAGPAAGPVTIWGLPAGLVAAVAPTPVAALVQLPTLLCLRWILLVAALGARLGLPSISAVPAVAAAAIVCAIGVVTLIRARRRRGAGSAPVGSSAVERGTGQPTTSSSVAHRP